jgi:hypothetical protein
MRWNELHARSSGCHIRVLSLWRPWSFSIFHPSEDRKSIENRTWLPPIELIGKRLALHDAKKLDESAFRLFRENGLTDFPNRYDAYPSGVIVGVVTIDRVVTEDRTLTPQQRRWYFGDVGWILSDARRLPTPIEHRGGQGLRNLPETKTRMILEQLGIEPTDAAIRGDTTRDGDA